MKPKVDNDLCIGCGTCEALAPDVFKVEDDGKAHVIKSADYASHEQAIDQAVESCPANAISKE